MNKETLREANKLTKQISDLTTILHPEKIRSLSFYEDTERARIKAGKENKMFYDPSCSLNLWDSDIINELLKVMQEYAEEKFKEVKKQLGEL